MADESSVRRTNVLIASDHAGVELKASLKKLMPDYKWTDLGPVTTDSVDYPDFAERLAVDVASGSAPLGILICGTGIGMCIAANKVPGIRAAQVGDPVSARLSREHNDANVLCLGARFIAAEYAAEIARVFLTTEFSKEAKHQVRVQKVARLEMRASG